jgi:quinol monooxygenase YgiN
MKVNADLNGDKVMATDTELLLYVYYKIRDGKRDEFIGKILEYGIDKASQQETGNHFYNFSRPVDDEAIVLLIESWTDMDALSLHTKTEHYKKLTELKTEYVDSVSVKKYTGSALK